MTRTPTLSTNVRSFGYDPAIKVLEIELVTGEVYQYEDVPADVNAALLQCVNDGLRFRAMVIQRVRGKFQFRKVEPTKEKAA